MMGKTFICKHCKKPLTATPKLIAVGNAFHPECFNELHELQREKDRERERKLLDRAEYDQYWARFEAKLRLKEEEAKRKARIIPQPRKTVDDVWAEKLAGRRFEDATTAPKGRLLIEQRLVR
jgi:hypothetical protein